MYRNILQVSFKFASAKKATCLYRVLNISAEASQAEIKQAYFELAKKYHPDTNPESSPEKFREIQEAYAVLSNEHKRKLYDDENGIMGSQGDPTFGQQDEIYKKYAQMDEQTIYQKNKDEYIKYFESQYFNNKEYFKRKVDEDSHWNMSESLFMKHEKNIRQQKSEYVVIQPFQQQHYWERKEDLIEKQKNKQFIQQQKNIRKLTSAQIIGILKSSSSLVVSFSILFIGIYIFNKQNQNKQQLSKAETLTQGAGYRVKMMPLNIS